MATAEHLNLTVVPEVEIPKSVDKQVQEQRVEVQVGEGQGTRYGGEIGGGVNRQCGGERRSEPEGGVVPDFVTCAAERERWVETMECFAHLNLNFASVTCGGGNGFRDFTGLPLPNPYPSDGGYYLHVRQPTASILPRFIILALVNTPHLPRKPDTK